MNALDTLRESIGRPYDREAVDAALADLDALMQAASDLWPPHRFDCLPHSERGCTCGLKEFRAALARVKEEQT